MPTVRFRRAKTLYVRLVTWYWRCCIGALWWAQTWLAGYLSSVRARPHCVAFLLPHPVWTGNSSHWGSNQSSCDPLSSASTYSCWLTRSMNALRNVRQNLKPDSRWLSFPPARFLFLFSRPLLLVHRGHVQVLYFSSLQSDCELKCSSPGSLRFNYWGGGVHRLLSQPGSRLEAQIVDFTVQK